MRHFGQIAQITLSKPLLMTKMSGWSFDRFLGHTFGVFGIHLAMNREGFLANTLEVFGEHLGHVLMGFWRTLLGFWRTVKGLLFAKNWFKMPLLCSNSIVSTNYFIPPYNQSIILTCACAHIRTCGRVHHSQHYCFASLSGVSGKRFQRSASPLPLPPIFRNIPLLI